MTTYRLYPSNPAVTLVSYSGPFMAGINFSVTSSPVWFTGYWWYVPAGGDTGAQKFCLWNVSGTGETGTLITAGTVTSGTLTAGQWNFTGLATPVQLAIGTSYIGCTAWTASNGFPATNNQFGSGQPFAAGITSGPLFAYSDTTGSAPGPYSMSQGAFSDTLGTDPAVHFPDGGSNSANFGMDVQVTNTPPGSWSGTYRLWPNKFDANTAVAADTAVNYTIATEMTVSSAWQYVTLNNIWYYTPSGSTGTLATRADIWNISTGLAVVTISSPSWSGAAGSGWVSAAFPGGTTLAPGDYRVSVFNSTGTTGTWGAKDAQTDYWGQTLTQAYDATFGCFNAQGDNGITWGPLTAPPWSAASSGFTYNAADPGNTPPYGTTATNAQSVFGQNPGGTIQFPQLYAPVGGSTNQSQNYWVDLEVTPGPLAAGAPQQPPFLYVQRRV